MRVQNDFPPEFIADDGEKITVNVTAKNPSMNFEVSFKVGDQKSKPLPEGQAVQFTMRKTFPELVFALQLGFTPNDGTGVYGVSIEGTGPDGGTFNDDFDSKFGTDPLIIPFTFFVSN